MFLFKNPNFAGIFKSYDIDLCGKKTWEWVKLACSGYETKIAHCTPDSDILALVKSLLTNKKYTLVLFSDTPLLTKSTIDEILSFVRMRDINVLNLIRGYVFNTEYIKTAENIKSSIIEKFNEIEFAVADNPKKLEKIAQVLKSKIINYHFSNGVIITSANAVQIDADVTIESGSIIEPFNSLKGRTYIGKNCRLESGNTIIDSIVGDGCIIKSSYIFSSKIDKNMVIGPFDKVINKTN
ncbi:MAG: hypothetical protein PHH71_00430 [Clostridia bacterium]|nr:hypothetical protein [Clostridia bacterium]MDD3231983.1 hypothetical protein [Clostridia bacterium]MDD3862668.1 hypothetical protein [Clostridia bacterium]